MPPKPINMKGEKHGMLTCLEYAGSRKGTGALWLCRCDCGNTKIVSRSDLIKADSGKGVRSCGCLAKKSLDQNRQQLIGNYKDISEQEFGYLTAIEPVDTSNDGKTIWSCRCECGNYIEVRINNLESGNTTSCGCRIMSKGEEKIFNLLIEAGIPFKREVRINYEDGSYGRFDFYINNRYVIEYDGIQHFEERDWGDPLELIQERDIKKNEYCQQHNIPLIRIPYTKYDTLTINDLILEKKEKQDERYI